MNDNDVIGVCLAICIIALGLSNIAWFMSLEFNTSFLDGYSEYYIIEEVDLNSNEDSFKFSYNFKGTYKDLNTDSIYDIGDTLWLEFKEIR